MRAVADIKLQKGINLCIPRKLSNVARESVGKSSGTAMA